MSEELELPSQYDPKHVEARLYDFWQKLGVFTPSADGKKPRYCIIMPPPNVTGVLHMGHALMCTIEDVLVRRKRMQGFDTLWLPGTDHAGIATQMVVERMILKEEKKSRHDLGREEFLKRVWKWKEQSQNTILSQLKVMGSSCDWTRLKFTLDPDVSLAVRETFVRLYNEKLIYRDEAITQWCPRCHTALSDLEVKFQEKPGKLWHIRYLLKSDPKKWLVVATTRPETLLGDTAVAVHPEDDRFKSFQGEVILPLLKREIPIVRDSYVDKAFGTGALKITPAHDPNDYMVGKRHRLPAINIFDESAKVNAAGGPYQGLPREKAREKILADLVAEGLLEKEVDHTHNVGHCDRCGTIVEPRLSAQWFVNAQILAKPAIEAVEKKEIKIIPEEWEKTYFQWMYNIRPWCISRQLWWGHRIPVWYCQDCPAMQAALETPATCQSCGSSQVKQDEDVLDTWFSSGLWPFSTLGWPKDTLDMKQFYPTDVMETGFDILFFWVARMIMLGIKMAGKIPFHTIYLHPMVRDEYGQKMSKTKNNVVDPLEVVSTMGADSLRHFFVSNAFHGRDVRVSDSQLEGCRNFVNKIWNASRFVLRHFGDVRKPNRDMKNEVNQWIWDALNETKREVNQALDQYRFFDAANKLYHFLWDTYCFWFIEFIKSEEELEARKKAKESTAVEVLEETLRLLHPIMPFVTEEIWQRLAIRSRAQSIALANYPEPSKSEEFPLARERIGVLCSAIEEVRRYRGENNLSPAKVIRVAGHLSEAKKNFIPLLEKLGRLTYEQCTEHKEETKFHFLDAVDNSQIKARKEKELEQVLQALHRANEKLKNERFMNSAPENVKAGVIKQRDDLQKEATALESYLKELGG